MSSKENYDKKPSIIQWRNGSGSDSTNALPTSIAVIPVSLAASLPQNTRSKISQTLSINGRSSKTSYFSKARIRAPSLVWEGVAGHLKGGVTAPSSPRVTAMGVATTVNATAEAIFSQQIAGSLSAHNSEINCRSDGVTPTPPSHSTDFTEFVIRPNKPNAISSSSYHPPSLVREDSVLNSLECWDYSVELECLQGPDDLQLAAELGKTLLERNKELENSLKEQQAFIDDQAQEIEYLTKQTSTLREINDSRVKIYEQLEVSIADLESTNKHLVEESKSDKSRIKSLCANINRLESRCEELQRCLDEARLSLESSERRSKNLNYDSTNDTEKQSSHSESSNMMTSAVFSSEVNGFDASNVICAEPSSHYEKMSDILDEESSDMKINNIKEECKTEMNHNIIQNTTQDCNEPVPSVNKEINSYKKMEISKHLVFGQNLESSNNYTSMSGYDSNSNNKSEDSGYENGEFSDKYFTSRTSETDVCHNTISSSSSSCSPAPKSSSSGSRVGSAFSDSPMESEGPISLGTDLPSLPNNILSDEQLPNSSGFHAEDTEQMKFQGISDQIRGNITSLEMDDIFSKSTVNEMERAISDLKSENLRLKLDLGIKHDRDTASVDESLRSVDDEVQEVTAVRMGKLCRRCLGINDATPGILIDKAMDLMGETLVSELQHNFGSSSNNWVQYMKSSRVWLDAWLAGLCACAFLIALLRRVLDVSSSITCDLMETWVTGNTEDEIT